MVVKLNDREQLALANDIMKVVMTDLSDRSGVLDGIADDILEEMRKDLKEQIHETIVSYGN